MKRWQSSLLFDAANYLFMLALIFIIFYPFLYIVSYSLSTPSRLPEGLLFWPAGFSADSYRAALENPDMLHGILVSALRTVIGPLVMVAVTSMVAYALTRQDLVGVKFFRKFFVLTMYFSSGLIPMYILAQTLHLTGSFWVYILPEAVVIFYMILIKTYIESLPRELEESALIDGANDLYLYWRIIFPVCAPVMAAVTLFAAVQQWNSFIDTEIYNAMSPENHTLQYLLYLTVSAQSGSDQQMQNEFANQVTPQTLKMAVTVITVLPIALVYPMLQRFFTKGLLIGSIKG